MTSPPTLLFDPASVSSVRALLQAADSTPNRLLGQNFIIDKRALDRFIALADLAPSDEVLEVGPGLGALTVRLVAHCARVVAVEKDAKLLEVLKHHLRVPHLHLIRDDALRIAWPDMELPQTGVKIVANMPYSISKPMLRRVLEEWRPHLTSATLMVQREVSDRILAAPNTEPYGPLALMTCLHARARRAFDLPPGAFYPAPQIASSAVHLEMLEQPLIELRNEKMFWIVVRAAFGTRRKQLGVALRALPFDRPMIADALSQAGIDPQRRGETLDLDEFARLSDAFGEGQAP